jgi:transposase
LSKTAIARKLGISRRTVHRDVASGEDEPRDGPRPARPSKLDPCKADLAERLAAYCERSATRLLLELRERGYTGGYSLLKDHLRACRPPPPLVLERRFEVSPGEQAQVDFATFPTTFGTVYALLVVLSWSRTRGVRFAFAQDQLTLRSGLAQAFGAFGGVPHTLLFDRMKAVVATATPQGQPVFQDERVRVARHDGVRLRACQPDRAKTKGRVERAVSCLRQGFLDGRSFRDLADLTGQCHRWLAEIANHRGHATTGETPVARLARERRSLLALPSSRYLPLVALGRRASRAGFIS